jgi:hypothetical protein
VVAIQINPTDQAYKSINKKPEIVFQLDLKKCPIFIELDRPTLFPEVRIERIQNAKSKHHLTLSSGVETMLPDSTTDGHLKVKPDGRRSMQIAFRTANDQEWLTIVYSRPRKKA